MSTAEDIDWDPMKNDSESFRNTVFQISDPGTYNISEQGTQLSKNILCPFFDPKSSINGKCFKGNNCSYFHGKYSSSVVHALPKLAPADIEGITISTDLPHKELAVDGCVTIAWVTTSVDPGEFYIIPKDGWNCLCTPVNIMADESGLAYNCPGFNTFEDLSNSLQKYMSQLMCHQPTTYVSGQLCAVKLSVTTKGKRWFRAIVLEDTIIEDNGDSSGAEVKLRLLDYGISAVKCAVDVVPLNKEFCHLSAMAYKCRLHGISPITGFWSSKAKKMFKNFVQGQFVYLEIKQSIPAVDGLFNLFESSPYLVEIHVKYNGNYFNVAEELVKEGLGLQWNFYKWRPFVNEILPYWKYSYMQRRQTASSAVDDEKMAKLVKEREESRLEKYIARTKYSK